MLLVKIKDMKFVPGECGTSTNGDNAFGSVHAFELVRKQTRRVKFALFLCTSVSHYYQVTTFQHRRKHSPFSTTSLLILLLLRVADKACVQSDWGKPTLCYLYRRSRNEIAIRCSVKGCTGAFLGARTNSAAFMPSVPRSPKFEQRNPACGKRRQELVFHH